MQVGRSFHVGQPLMTSPSGKPMQLVFTVFLHAAILGRPESQKFADPSPATPDSERPIGGCDKTCPAIAGIDDRRFSGPVPKTGAENHEDDPCPYVLAKPGLPCTPSCRRRLDGRRGGDRARGRPERRGFGAGNPPSAGARPHRPGGAPPRRRRPVLLRPPRRSGRTRALPLAGLLRTEASGGGLASGWLGAGQSGAGVWGPARILGTGSRPGRGP